MIRSKINYRINGQIRAPELRVIGSDGEQVGILKKEQALTKSREASLDLIEIAPNAVPPVAKMMELGKFLYQEEKRFRAQKRGAKAGELKEVRFSPFIAENDYNTRLARMKEFLSQKDKVKVVVVFKGRQMGSKDFGYNLLNRILDNLGDSVVTDMKPKFFGRHLAMIVSPTYKKTNAKTEN